MWTAESAVVGIRKWAQTLRTELEKPAWAHYEERQRVWVNDLTHCEEEPTLLVALLGGTGAGKSSLINALLGVEVVPTSGHRACTSVITEVAYHPHNHLKAEIQFLSKIEWEEEVTAILKDVKDEIERRREAQQKRHRKTHRAIHPAGTGDGSDFTITPNSLSEDSQSVYRGLGWEEFVQSTAEGLLTRPEVEGLLGKSTSVVKETDDGFATEVFRFAGDDGPWPLVRNVQIWCSAQCLSTGVTLVDLPGLADANKARYVVSENYIKKCDHIWHIVPIERAVDAQVTSGTHISVTPLAYDQIKEIYRYSRVVQEQIQKSFCSDGLYTPEKWTSIVTKCDSIALGETISSLRLDGEEEITRMQNEIKDYHAAIVQTKERLKRAVIAVEAKKSVLDVKHEVQDVKIPMKRESTSEPEGPFKRPHLDEGPSILSESHIIKDQATELITAVEEQEAIMNELKTYENTLAEVTKSLTAFCARKRSEDTRMRLTKRIMIEFNDFDLDMEYSDEEGTSEAEPEDTRPAQGADDGVITIARVGRASPVALTCLNSVNESGNFQEMECEADRMSSEGNDDYKSIVEPRLSKPLIFTISVWDFLKLDKNQESSTFLTVQDTQIPQLREHCRNLTEVSRKRYVAGCLEILVSVATSVVAYIEGLEHQDENARLALKQKWGSSLRGRMIELLVESANQAAQGVKVVFSEKLGQACREGEKAAVNKTRGIVGSVQDGMRWQRLRATYRRHGSWHVDINEHLLDPFTNRVARTWAALFERDIFKKVETDIKVQINSLVREVIDSCGTPASTEQAVRLGKVMYAEVSAVLPVISGKISARLETRQREISHSLVSSIQKPLVPAYDAALQFRGRGSVSEQKDYFNRFIEENKNTLFKDLSHKLLDDIDNVVDDIREELEKQFKVLARKVYYGMMPLWKEDTHIIEPDMKAQFSTWVEELKELRRGIFKDFNAMA
ncbi:hypothetical protein AX16_000816 [Volvariella volvacea WC 439]|nr:hypothetical protein AX16_000816 [Volvariella volvacea WC 439]